MGSVDDKIWSGENTYCLLGPSWSSATFIVLYGLKMDRELVQNDSSTGFIITIDTLTKLGRHFGDVLNN